MEYQHFNIFKTFLSKLYIPHLKDLNYTTKIFLKRNNFSFLSLKSPGQAQLFRHQRQGIRNALLKISPEFFSTSTPFIKIKSKTKESLPHILLPPHEQSKNLGNANY